MPITCQIRFLRQGQVLVEQTFSPRPSILAEAFRDDRMLDRIVALYDETPDAVNWDKVTIEFNKSRS